MMNQKLLLTMYDIFHTTPNWNKYENYLGYRIFWLNSGDDIENLTKEQYDELPQSLQKKIDVTKTCVGDSVVYTFKKNFHNSTFPLTTINSYPIFSTNPHWSKNCNGVAFMLFWLNKGDDVNITKQEFDELCPVVQNKIHVTSSYEDGGVIPIYSFKKK